MADVLWLNNDGSWTQVSGGPTGGTAVAFADVDGDGSARLASNDAARLTSPAFLTVRRFIFLRCSDLDLFVGKGAFSATCAPFNGGPSVAGAPNQLWLNDGAGTSWTAAGGPASGGNDATYVALFADIDNDG